MLKVLGNVYVSLGLIYILFCFQLEDEIKMLSEKIEGEKPNIRRLTDTVEQLLTNVTMSA